jgi:hypothetical protein
VFAGTPMAPALFTVTPAFAGDRPVAVA